MATIQVKSAGVLTTGSTGADIIAFANSAGPKNTVLGLAGNDTITLQATVSGVGAFSVNAAGGRDSLTVGNTSHSMSGSTILGGAGGDTIDFDASALTASTLNGGDGNDTITFSGIVSKSNVTLGGGSDSIIVSAGGLAFASSTLAGGSGDDTITFSAVGSLQSSQILGGGGKDRITISAAATTNTTGLSINSDSAANGGGNDTITMSTVTGASVDIKGKGGKDRISLFTVAGTGSQVLGNAGADNITVTGKVVGSGNLIGGGSGNDTITLSGLGGTNSVIGGGGADSITLTGAAVNSGVVNAGAGKDTVSVGTIFSGTLALGALTDSTLSKLDTFQSTTNSVQGTGLRFTLSAVSTTSPTTGVAGGAEFSGSTIYADGTLDSSDFVTAGNVTARAAIIDAQGGPANSVFVFEAENASYLFIQGGAAGTADDYVARVGTGTRAVSGISLVFASASITL
jgi:hypothetical protein